MCNNVVLVHRGFCRLNKRPVGVLGFVAYLIHFAAWLTSLAELDEQVDMIEFGLVAVEVVVVVVYIAVVVANILVWGIPANDG